VTIDRLRAHWGFSRMPLSGLPRGLRAARFFRSGGKDGSTNSRPVT
jgi:hypothetical protein